MNRLALIVVALVLVDCSAPVPPLANEITAVVETEDGFVAWSEGLPIEVKVSGTIATPLAGSPVLIRVALPSQTGTNSTRSITIVPELTGTFSETVVLNASEPGEATAYAEVSARSDVSDPFVIASGKLATGYFERTDGGIHVGCVDVSGAAEKLVVEVDDVDQVDPAPTRNRRACDGTASKDSLSFSVPSTTTAWKIKEATNRLPALLLKPPTQPRTVALVEPLGADGGTGTLPAPGAPVLIRLRFAGGNSPAFAPYRALVAPQDDGGGVVELTGTADGAGLASLLLISPEASQLVVRLQSGRLEEVLTFSR